MSHPLILKKLVIWPFTILIFPVAVVTAALLPARIVMVLLPLPVVKSPRRLTVVELNVDVPFSEKPGDCVETIRNEELFPETKYNASAIRAGIAAKR